MNYTILYYNTRGSANSKNKTHKEASENILKNDIK